jgi:hypothetical protein
MHALELDVLACYAKLFKCQLSRLEPSIKIASTQSVFKANNKQIAFVSFQNIEKKEKNRYILCKCLKEIKHRTKN